MDNYYLIKNLLINYYNCYNYNHPSKFNFKKTFTDREKSSPFECGFDPKSSARLPFSLHFFLIAVIFLIFDVEITLLFPIILSIKTSNITAFFIVLLTFIIILLAGTYHEWKQGALDWTN
uniref:NADH-ubiquinone oxidoreductase chain 3 n=1 Tax=Formicomus sp. FOR01 TaxID=1205554 RepID=A0A0S2MSF7_9CUCU|nr:NADH deshydrogenase subunit 3 [Formicomus sp. FOR01]